MNTSVNPLIFKYIIENLSEGIIFVNTDNRVVFCNHAAEVIRGIRKEDIIGNSVMDCHVPKMRQAVEKIIESFKSNKASEYHRMVASTNGDRYYDNVYAAVRDENGGFVGMILVSRDVTEKVKMQKKVEEYMKVLEDHVQERTKELQDAYKKLKSAQGQIIQSEKMASLGRLVAGVAHEINNPLDGIQNSIHNMIQNPEDRTKNVVYLNLILENIERIESIVKQLLGYARARNYQMEAISLKEIIEKSLFLLEYRLSRSGVEVSKYYPDDDIIVRGDDNHLQQVIMNILLNAIDAMPNGGELRIQVKRDNGKWANIAIEDTGIGISKDDLPRIFDPFFTTKEVGRGTGLGLAVSLGIIEEHGGTIKVKSKIGHGTTFSIAIPLLKSGQTKPFRYSEAQ